jgi:hypothetical protein
MTESLNEALTLKSSPTENKLILHYKDISVDAVYENINGLS